MVSRIPPPEDGSSLRPGRSTGAAALVLVLLVVLGIWQINGRGPDTPTSTGGENNATAIDSSTSPEPPEPPEPPSSLSAKSALSSRSASPTAEPTDEPPAPATSAPAVDPDSGLATVYLLDLPPEAAETVQVIDSGPPYPYGQDGNTFGNYEGLLPDHDRGYYQEFTVETPGSSDRGARRIVEGADAELYWTDDHYESFYRILL